MRAPGPGQLVRFSRSPRPTEAATAVGGGLAPPKRRESRKETIRDRRGGWKNGKVTLWLCQNSY